MVGGQVAHGLLDGKVVEGKHEKMVSQDVFFKIHNLQIASTQHGVPHKKENDEIPLKVFVKCDDCGEPLTGYVVKKKNLYYYKCRKKGCKSNKSAKEMHKLFVQELGKLEVNKELLPAIAYEMEYVYHNQNKDNADMEINLNQRLSDLKIEMDRLDEKHYIKEELNKEKYDRMMLKLTAEEKEIYENLAHCAVSISNLSDKIIEIG